LKNTLTLVMDPAVLSPADVVAAVTKAGYGASLRAAKDKKAGGAGYGNESADPATAELQAVKHRLTVSLIFTIPLFVLAMGPMAGLPLPGTFRGAENALVFALSQFLLTLPVLFVNAALFRTGFKTLFSGADPKQAVENLMQRDRTQEHAQEMFYNGLNN
jgi:cation transport ATPase